MDLTPPLPRLLDVLLPCCIEFAVSQGSVGVMASTCHPTGKEECKSQGSFSVFWDGRSKYRQGWGSKSLGFFGTGGKRIVCQPLGLVSTPGLSVALDNCIGANGATMLRNTYIISRGDSSVSVLRSH